MPDQLRRSTAEEEGPLVDGILEALSDGQRRTALRVLVASDGAMAVRELAHEMAVVVESPTSSPNHIVTALHHNHLPRLDDMGIVTYDMEANVVECRDAIEELTPLLEFLEVKRTQ